MLRRIQVALTSWLPSRRRGVEELLDQLSASQARQRWEAAEALAPYSGQTSVAEALIEALGDPHPFVRWQAGESLAQRKDDRT